MLGADLWVSKKILGIQSSCFFPGTSIDYSLSIWILINTFAFIIFYLFLMPYYFWRFIELNQSINFNYYAVG